MTSRTASGTKLLDGLEEHHCKVGVLLASQQDAPTACLMAERPSRKFHRCLSPGAPGRGAARNFLFQPVPPAASGGRGWRGYGGTPRNFLFTARNFLFQPVPPAASGGRGWRGYGGRKGVRGPRFEKSDRKFLLPSSLCRVLLPIGGGFGRDSATRGHTGAAPARSDV